MTIIALILSVSVVIILFKIGEWMGNINKNG